jgi:tRNA(Ser,Leu) C12 N-acetylase TAN1
MSNEIKELVARAIADAQNFSSDGSQRTDIYFTVLDVHQVTAEHVLRMLKHNGYAIEHRGSFW